MINLVNPAHFEALKLYTTVKVNRGNEKERSRSALSATFSGASRSFAAQPYPGARRRGNVVMERVQG